MSRHEDFLQLLLQVDDLVSAFERHPDERVRGLVASLLVGIDHLHRAGLTRLVNALRARGAGDLLDEAAEDPIVSVLLGLYDLRELPFQEAPAGATGLVQLGLPPREPKATWVEVARGEQLPPGTLRAVEARGMRVLLVNVEGEVYAFRNACPGTTLTLELSHLEGTELSCPWHGCRFDARTGVRLGPGEGRLEVFPVAVRDGSVQLALAAAGE